jgi:methylated-DNA-[protein]-cysteine S-methyltransferase
VRLSLVREKPYAAIIASPLGHQLGIHIDDEQLARIDFISPTNVAPILPSTDFAKRVVAELESYFENPKFIFTLPLKLKGTAFQQRVWDAVAAIPAGSTATYSDIAKKLNSGPRAVGSACRCNPIPIIVPCHRVVAKNSMGGYSGFRDGVIFSIKEWLLDHENV